MQRFIIVCALLLLVNCAGSPYEKGKSVADVPSHIETINLKKVYMAGSDTEPNGDPKPDTSLSQNDQEVAALVRANIASQLTNFGYKITEGANSADITMSYFISYMPERLLVSRSVNVTGRVYDADGSAIFSMRTYKTHDTGNLIGNLVNAVAGSSRDEMVSDATRETVVKVVNEMRKGTKENTPVADASQTSVVAISGAAP